MKKPGIESRARTPTTVPVSLRGAAPPRGPRAEQRADDERQQRADADQCDRPGQLVPQDVERRAGCAARRSRDLRAADPTRTRGTARGSAGRVRSPRASARCTSDRGPAGHLRRGIRPDRRAPSRATRSSASPPPTIRGRIALLAARRSWVSPAVLLRWPPRRRPRAGTTTCGRCRSRGFRSSRRTCRRGSAQNSSG